MRIQLVAACVWISFLAVAFGTCQNDGWCDTASLSGYYQCSGLTDCITVKLAMKDHKDKFIQLQYNTPAFKDGANAAAEFDLPPFEDFHKTQSLNDDAAYFQLAAPLMLPQNQLVAGYLLVMQALAFKDLSYAEIPVPTIPNRDPFKVCATTMTNGVCDPKSVHAGHYKWSFAAYQTIDCEFPAECYFFMRTSVDTSATGAGITFNGDSALTLATPPSQSTPVTRMSIGDINIDFPTGVNVNNDKWEANGATVYVERTEGKVVHLAMKVLAPGKDKFVLYDPDVSGTTSDGTAAATDGTPAATSGSTAAGTPAATSGSTSAGTDGTPAATSGSTSAGTDGTPAASGSTGTAGATDGTPAATSGSTSEGTAASTTAATKGDVSAAPFSLFAPLAALMAPLITAALLA